VGVVRDEECVSESTHREDFGDIGEPVGQFENWDEDARDETQWQDDGLQVLDRVR
jgi:hypothetical protein